MASSHTPRLVIAALLAAGLGCSKKPPVDKAAADAGTAPTAVEATAPGPNIVRDQGPLPGPETTIATAGDFAVTVADFDEASRISLLFAPDGQTSLSPEQLAIPHVHLTMTRSLLSQKLIAAELERRSLAPTKEEMDAWLREHPKLGRFGKLIDDPAALAGALDPLGLKPEHLSKVAQAELSNLLLADAMAREITDDEIWSVYQFEGTLRTVAIVASPNVPSSEEIDDWMGKHADEIDEHFRKNPNKYRSPRRVKLNIVKPAPGAEVDKEALHNASELLLRGVQPATVAKELGLEFELEAQLVRGENPKAFQQTPGQGGWMESGARGAYAWKVVGFEPSTLPEMTRPLRREIAAELLRSTTVVKSVADRLDLARKALASARLAPGDAGAVDALEKEIEAIDGLTFQINSFPNSPRAPIPVYGLAEQVIEQGFATPVGETTEPFLSRERAFLIRVLAKQTPDRKDFDANIEANRKAFIEAVRPRIVMNWAERRLNELGTKIDVKPLRIKYGVLQKE